MTVLPDSDVLIEVLRNRDETVTQWANLSQSEAVILYSPISEAELWAGVRPKEERAITTLLGNLICVPVDRDIARRAGGYLLQFQKSHALKIADALIGATATVRNALLWTRNRKHFPMKDLKFFHQALEASPDA